LADEPANLRPAFSGRPTPQHRGKSLSGKFIRNGLLLGRHRERVQCDEKVFLNYSDGAGEDPLQTARGFEK